MKWLLRRVTLRETKLYPVGKKISKDSVDFQLKCVLSFLHTVFFYKKNITFETFISFEKILYYRSPSEDTGHW